MKSLKVDERTLEIVRFYFKLAVADMRNRAARHRKRCGPVYGSWKRSYEPFFFQSFEKKFLHSCIKNLINIKKKNKISSQTTEQADYPPLRYVT